MRRPSAVVTILLAACLGLAVHAASAAAKAEILLGSFGVTKVAGAYAIAGWACSKGTAAQVMMNVYLDGAYPLGSSWGGRAANLASLPAVVAKCGGAGADFNFSIPVTGEMIFKHGGHPIFMYALSPTNGPPLLLANSGTIRLPAYNPAPASAAICSLSQGDPQKCLANIGSYDEVSFASDVTCASAATCCPNGNALFTLNGLSNKVIKGNGHLLMRSANQEACPAINITNSANILVDGLRIDEDLNSPACEYPDFFNNGPCAVTGGAAISAVGDTNVKLHSVSVYNGKGYVVHAVQLAGFSFDASSVSESGVIGLYVGYVGAASTNVAITDSVFSGSRTNGLAIQGATSGSTTDPILIANNIFNRNHYHGIFPVGTTGGVSPGGQMLIADGTNIRVVNNIIADGYCSNCYVSKGVTGTGISAVETADVGSAPLGAYDLTLDHNYFYNGNPTVSAIYQNPGSQVPSPVITNNVVVGFLNVTNIPATQGTIQNNQQVSAIPSLSLNGGAYNDIYREATADYTSPNPSADGTHWESKLPGELAAYFGCGVTRTCSATLEATFGLSSEPLVGGPTRPVFRCFSGKQVPGQYIQPIAPSSDDFISTDQYCGGKGLLHAIAGYSFPARFASAQPFYGCHTQYADGTVDHFVSWDKACEGKLKDGQLGYAVVPAK